MTIFALTLIPLQASAQIMPPNTVPHLITIRKQDLETMKRLQQEKEKMRDYNNRQVNKEELTRELLKRRRELVKRVKRPEYKIKRTYVEKIDLAENGVLTQEEIAGIVKDYEKTDLTSDSLKVLIKRIDKLCVEKGYITAFAYMPKQDIKDGLLKIALKEGKVGRIRNQLCAGFQQVFQPIVLM